MAFAFSESAAFCNLPSRTTCYDRHDLSSDEERRDGAPGRKGGAAWS
jgi:hypothetical protein